MATHAVLEALGIEYKLIEIDLSKGQQKSAEYLAINPNGKVPTLVHHLQGKDHVIYESAAILIYVLDQHTDSELAPPLGSPQRGAYYQYLFWMASTLQEAANRWAHPEHYIDLEGFDDSRHDTKESLSLIVEKAGSELARCWQILDHDLSKKGPWLLGENVSGADFHLFMIAYWSRRYDSKAQDFPHLKQHIKAMLSLESIQTMMQQEVLEFDF
jgi:glutathione S-transferase